MDSNTHSTLSTQSAPVPPVLPDDLAELAAVLDKLANQDLNQLPATVRAERALALEPLANRLGGQWLKELAGVDAIGAAGADRDQPAESTAGWLRNRLRMSATSAREAVGTARALFRGPLSRTAQALTSGKISCAHARVLAQGTRQLPDHVARDAEPVLLEIARWVDPPRLRQAVDHLVLVADPDAADRQADHRHQCRRLWLSPTLDGMVAIDGLLEPEAGTTVLAALEPLARPAEAGDTRSGSQRNADALTELARRALEAGRLPKAGGVRPSCWSPSTSTPSWATTAASAGTWGGPGHWNPKPAGDSPATGR